MLYSHVVIGIDRQNPTKAIEGSHRVHNAMIAAKTPYVAPPVSAATLLGQIQALETAQQSVVARVPGAAAGRRLKVRAVFTSLELLRTYIQSLVDAAPDQAETITKGSGFTSAAPSRRNKPILAVTPVQPEGSARLVANGTALIGDREGQHVFCWQFSTNGGQTWNDGLATPGTETTVSGLPRLTVCLFRVAVRNLQDQTPWSPIVSVLIP